MQQKRLLIEVASEVVNVISVTVVLSCHCGVGLNFSSTWSSGSRFPVELSVSVTVWSRERHWWHEWRVVVAKHKFKWVKYKDMCTAFKMISEQKVIDRTDWNYKY